jgi:hypothetical protein
MIRFTVTWDQDVEGPFIDAWVSGNSQMRGTLTEIANWVDTQLTEHPAAKGKKLTSPTLASWLSRSLNHQHMFR